MGALTVTEVVAALADLPFVPGVAVLGVDVSDVYPPTPADPHPHAHARTRVRVHTHTLDGALALADAWGLTYYPAPAPDGTLDPAADRGDAARWVAHRWSVARTDGGPLVEVVTVIQADTTIPDGAGSVPVTAGRVGTLTAGGAR